MAQISAGLLLFRRNPHGLQVLLAHPGGPFFKNKDDGAWTIPKGAVEPGEELLAAAKREFTEEIGFEPVGPFLPLESIKQKGGKTIHAWAFEADFNPVDLRSNTFTMEWPPRSGRQATFVEVDRAEFFDLSQARQKMNPAQCALLDRLVAALNPSAG